VIRFEAIPADRPPAADLIAAMVAEMATLYGPIDVPGMPSATPADFRPPQGTFLVGFDRGGTPVCAGGVKRLDDEAAEIKRMYVVPAARGRGLARVLLGALEEAARAGALTVALVCASRSELGRRADRELAVVVGPEVIIGSTRMKAGTAQKLVLNTISTVTMVRLGKTFGNLMVGVEPANEKLRLRARAAVAIATAVPDEEVDAALAAAGGDAKVAIVSLLAGVDAEAARARLEAAGGAVRQALAGAADVVGRS
jgi:N-acetylmuramic acid 6-phosphate etherase